jgi:hypothetical protein
MLLGGYSARNRSSADGVFSAKALSQARRTSARLTASPLAVGTATLEAVHMLKAAIHALSFLFVDVFIAVPLLKVQPKVTFARLGAGSCCSGTGHHPSVLQTLRQPANCACVIGWGHACHSKGSAFRREH